MENTYQQKILAYFQYRIEAYKTLDKFPLPKEYKEAGLQLDKANYELVKALFEKGICYELFPLLKKSINSYYLFKLHEKKLALQIVVVFLSGEALLIVIIILLLIEAFEILVLKKEMNKTTITFNLIAILLPILRNLKGVGPLCEKIQLFLSEQSKVSATNTRPLLQYTYQKAAMSITNIKNNTIYINSIKTTRTNLDAWHQTMIKFVDYIKSLSQKVKDCEQIKKIIPVLEKRINDLLLKAKNEEIILQTKSIQSGNPLIKCSMEQLNRRLQSAQSRLAAVQKSLKTYPNSPILNKSILEIQNEIESIIRAIRQKQLGIDWP